MWAAGPSAGCRRSPGFCQRSKGGRGGEEREQHSQQSSLDRSLRGRLETWVQNLVVVVMCIHCLNINTSTHTYFSRENFVTTPGMRPENSLSLASSLVSFFNVDRAWGALPLRLFPAMDSSSRLVSMASLYALVLPNSPLTLLLLRSRRLRGEASEKRVMVPNRTAPRIQD
jgi:hypothetical protein